MLELRRRHSDEVHHLPGRVRLTAEATWEVSGPADEIALLHARLPASAVDVWRGGARLAFGNCVGHFDLGALGAIESFSGKWDQQAFDGMLSDLSRRASALPFDHGTGSSLPYDRTMADDPDLLWHAYVYLRHVLSDHAPSDEALVPALRTVVRDPHRVWRRRDEEVPTGRAADVSAGTLLDVASGRFPLVEVPSGAFAMGDALEGHLPTRVRAGRRDSTWDSPPNRFVLAFLGQCLGVLARVESLGKPGLASEARGLRARLDPIRRADLWSGVGPMTHLPSSSTVLQGRRGYREVFRVAQRLRLSSRAPIDPDRVVGWLENKDIATLYEMWVYFAVVDAVAHVLDRPAAAASWRRSEVALTLPWRYRVVWRDGTEVLYNATFSRASALRSWSLPLRPDVLVRTRGAELHVVDAKFKLRWVDGDTEDDERRGVFQNADVYKMHAYRDALEGVRTAWVAYPGDERRVFDGPDGAVGAVGVAPGREEELRALVAEILKGGLTRR